MLKRTVESWVDAAVRALCRELGDPGPAAVQVERPQDRAHGDYSSNAALVLASRLKCRPRELAERLRQHVPTAASLERVEVAGPGFLNFHLRTDALRAEIIAILRNGEGYGRLQFGAGRRVLVEFVSANPTGPLHVGHGRSAVYGDILANLLDACGYRVEREYYVNDCGLQADMLGLSLLLRRLERTGRPAPAFPEGAYRGAYVDAIADALPPRWDPSLDALGAWPELPSDATPEEYADRLLGYARQRLGAEYDRLGHFAMERILADIRASLERLGIRFDRWVHESMLRQGGQIAGGIAELERAGVLYRKDGATWFRSSALGDEKDRVLVRANGMPTYFAADVCYHADKYRRGYELIVNVWGADHHGYIDRLRAAVRSLGLDDQRLEILLVQFVALCHGRKRTTMSTRQGRYVTLDTLHQDVGTASVRFLYVTRNSGQHLDFDLALAKSCNHDNPVYYVQYAHARICSILGKAGDAHAIRESRELAAADTPEERALMAELAAYPEIVEAAGRQREPHLLAFYLQALAGRFHAYYNRCQVLAAEPGLRRARLGLVRAVRQVLRNGLGLTGVKAPEHM